MNGEEEREIVLESDGNNAMWTVEMSAFLSGFSCPTPTLLFLASMLLGLGEATHSELLGRKRVNYEGCWTATDDFTTGFLHFSLFSTALWDLANSRTVHSLMLSPYLFLCLPCLLPPFTVPCKMVLARPDERETWSYHCSLRLFTLVRRSSCRPIPCLILAQTSWLVTWSLYVMHSILQQQLISIAWILLRSSTVSVHDSQAYRKMVVTRERI